MNAPFHATAALGRKALGQVVPEHQVAVIGLGYIGLPTAALLASYGWSVCGVDVSQNVVDTVNSGGVHIEERDLEMLVRNAITAQTLVASTEVPTASFYMIAVPTPLGEYNLPDISYVEAAARAIAPKIVPGACIIVESTSPVGTTERVAEIIATLRPDIVVPRDGSDDDADIALAYCPERVLPGRIVNELVHNDRVIGGVTAACAERAAVLYTSFVKGDCLYTSARVAETVKLVENSFRDVNIAFANELSMIAEEIGVDVWEVIRLANRHPRVNILQPGPGVGGHCIAVDPWFLVAGAPESARLVRTAREVNDHKAVHTERRIRALLEAAPEGKIALLGLAFKPDIDDFRESPALEIAEALSLTHGPRVLVVEPFTDQLPRYLAGTGAQLVTLDAGLRQAEIVVVLVDHTAFRHLTPVDLAGKIVFDTRGMLRR
ncbi:UDP-N-acetyl-D-mannosamine dehydrogenase [Porphyrobacter sp. CACIAM 03H1]|jgi:UDP-N-acetyl-D-mannosaminuronic acid dehydrogenase|uniref:UDP-N-acetyl-D-mannosamine dehydrogenase n=1 Tax=Porphyrobacter sp. CACIAM 03H1 TaxID=2003315 RepID=UPI000B5A3282|nr:UDP-N-acetyl-D-mannosamine dehydrogenase [Porphyrobacter sp. CACIAM 03H1]ASJ92381.1 UDP-N-acetyl-D-mannosamine dehydrogenase [Porphyrobacter sp. CACIAM 03H1]